MANTLITPTQLLRKGLSILHHKLKFIGTTNMQYDDQFAKSGAKIGNSLSLRMPNQYTVRTGAVMDVQDVVETSQTITVATQKGVDLSFTAIDRTLYIDDFALRYLDPAMSVLASAIEADAFNMYKDVYNSVGTPGTTPSGLRPFLDARMKLNQNLAPEDDLRYAQINSETSASMVDALKGLFNPTSTTSDQYKTGTLGSLAGLTFFENQLAPQHTNAAQAGAATAAVYLASQSGASINIDGMTGTTAIAKGTVVTFSSCYAVHPETKATLSHLQQFVITDAVVVSGGAAALTISPSIVTSGAKQNVSAGPGNDDVVTFWGSASTTYPQNIVYHKDAFAFVSADLVLPEDAEFAAREVFDGISMRVWRASNILNDTFPCRIDVLYGYKTLRPELAVRVWG